MKSIKKLGKIGTLLVVLIIGASVATTAILMTFYLKGNVNTDAGVILQWSDDNTTFVNAEDLEKTITLTGFVGGDTVTYDRWLKYSADADNNLVVKFTFTDTGVNDSEGVYIKLEKQVAGIWTEICNESGTPGLLTCVPGELYILKITVVGDTYLEQGDYAFTLDLVRNA